MSSMHVEAIYIAPVKSMAVMRLDRAEVRKRGIAGDRAFFVADERGRVVTQRDWGPMVRVRAAYDIQSERLRLDFPDGTSVEDAVETGEKLDGDFYGAPTHRGRAVCGPFDQALSRHAGRPLRLAKVDDDSHAFDVFPLSLCSSASVDHIRSVAAFDALDERRFRQNIIVAGAVDPHDEDAWIGRDVQVGRARLRVVTRDPRCVITTLDPDTGEQDLDTLNVIASYRTDQPKEANFGVYCAVVTTGAISVGDPISVLEQEAAS
jgi:uncharacterized protein YcbX